MKVLQINSVCGIGSTGRIATDIHKLLLEEGHESWIAYGRDKARNCKNTIKIGSTVDNYMHVAKTRILDQHGYGSKSATEEFILKVKELDPDIVHLHNIHGYYINTEILFDYLKSSNIKVVWTLHDCWAFTGHCTHFEYVSCNKWETGCYSCPQKKEYPSSFLLDNSKLNYIEKKKMFTSVSNMHIITPSKWLKRLVNRSFLGEFPVKTINNGIDLKVFKSRKSNFRKKYDIEDRFIILGIARWDKRKGLNYLIKLAAKLDKNFQVVVVGLSDKQKKEMPENIIGISQTDDVNELVEIYTAANLFVNPTLEDNFPTTNLEAMACGTPVVTFDTGGSSESIDETTGIVVEKGNFESLYNAILNIRKSDYEYSSTCTAKASHNFNSNDKYLEYLKLYEDINNDNVHKGI